MGAFPIFIKFGMRRKPLLFVVILRVWWARWWQLWPQRVAGMASGGPVAVTMGVLLRSQWASCCRHNGRPGAVTMGAAGAQAASSQTARRPVAVTMGVLLRSQWGRLGRRRPAASQPGVLLRSQWASCCGHNGRWRPVVVTMGDLLLSQCASCCGHNRLLLRSDRGCCTTRGAASPPAASKRPASQPAAIHQPASQQPASIPRAISTGSSRPKKSFVLLGKAICFLEETKMGIPSMSEMLKKLYVFNNNFKNY